MMKKEMSPTTSSRDEISTAFGFPPGAFDVESTPYDQEAGRLQILWGALHAHRPRKVFQIPEAAEKLAALAEADR